MTYELLRDVLANDLQMSAEDLSPTARCAEVRLESLAAVELADVLRDRYRIEIEDYEVLDAGTVADIATLLADRRAGSTAGEPGAAPVRGTS